MFSRVWQAYGSFTTRQPRFQLRQGFVSMGNLVLQKTSQRVGIRRNCRQRQEINIRSIYQQGTSAVLETTYLLLLTYLSIRPSLILKNRIPTKIRRASRRNQFPQRPSLKQYHLFTWTGAVRKCTYGHDGFIFVCCEEVVEAGVTQGGEEIFSTGRVSVRDKGQSKWCHKGGKKSHLETLENGDRHTYKVQVILSTPQILMLYLL